MMKQTEYVISLPTAFNSSFDERKFRVQKTEKIVENRGQRTKFSKIRNNYPLTIITTLLPNITAVMQNHFADFQFY
jgi:hypothetical protein